MPFKSEKQRRYLFANEPKVARKFADETRASGGMIKKALANAMRLPDLAHEKWWHGIQWLLNAPKG